MPDESTNPEHVADASESHAEPVNRPAPFPHYLTITQFVVRVLGVFFAIEGLTGIIGNGLDLVLQWQRLRQDGYGAWALDGPAFAWFTASLGQLCIGAYLAISGRWVIEKVFLPRSSEDEQPSDPGD